MIMIIIILICSLLRFSVHSFYITNAATLEQCSTETITYLQKFDPTKMFCVNQVWRQTFIYLQYSCIRNTLTRIWTIKTSDKKGSSWPQVISLMTDNAYTRFDKFDLNDDPTIEENSNSFDPNNNQLTTYLWTSLGIGPQCRFKYTIIKDICTGNSGPVGAKFTDIVCYYGKQSFNFQMMAHRQAFDKLIDDRRTASSNIAPNNPPSSMNQNTSQHIPDHSAFNSNDSALNTGGLPFWKKYKRYIIIGGIILVVIIIFAFIFLIIRSSSKKIEQKTSNESTVG